MSAALGSPSVPLRLLILREKAAQTMTTPKHAGPREIGRLGGPTGITCGELHRRAAEMGVDQAGIFLGAAPEPPSDAEEDFRPLTEAAARAMVYAHGQQSEVILTNGAPNPYIDTIAWALGGPIDYEAGLVELVRRAVLAYRAATRGIVEHPNHSEGYWRDSSVLEELHAITPTLTHGDIAERLAYIANDRMSIDDEEVIATFLAESERPTIVDLIADTLAERGSEAAADLVRDTDPDDDLWSNYIGPMIDSIESDYTASIDRDGE